MGAFDGADSIPAATKDGNFGPERPFLKAGVRLLSVDKVVQRLGANKTAKNHEQTLIIIEFTILETLEGEDLGSTGKIIETLWRTGREWKLTDPGKHAVGRVKSFVAAALKVPTEAITGAMLEKIDWADLTGAVVLATGKEIFDDSDWCVTTYEQAPAE